MPRAVSGRKGDSFAGDYARRPRLRRRWLPRRWYRRFLLSLSEIRIIGVFQGDIDEFVRARLRSTAYPPRIARLLPFAEPCASPDIRQRLIIRLPLHHAILQPTLLPPRSLLDLCLWTPTPTPTRTTARPLVPQSASAFCLASRLRHRRRWRHVGIQTRLPTRSRTIASWKMTQRRIYVASRVG
jgi:hypothetical protein